MVPEVIKIEEDGVLNHKNPVFLWYLGHEIIKQTKELSLIKYPFSFGTVPFGSARLQWNHSFRGPKRVLISGSKWNGSKVSRVNARPIRTNFGTVPFDSSVNGALRIMQGSGFIKI